MVVKNKRILRLGSSSPQESCHGLIFHVLMKESVVMKINSPIFWQDLRMLQTRQNKSSLVIPHRNSSINSHQQRNLLTPHLSLPSWEQIHFPAICTMIPANNPALPPGNGRGLATKCTQGRSGTCQAASFNLFIHNLFFQMVFPHLLLLLPLFGLEFNQSWIKTWGNNPPQRGPW